jgi:hypothetical protein
MQSNVNNNIYGLASTWDTNCSIVAPSGRCQSLHLRESINVQRMSLSSLAVQHTPQQTKRLQPRFGGSH